MPDTKRNLSEMGAAEIRVLLRDARRRAAVIEDELQRRTCVHTFEVCHVSGPEIIMNMNTYAQTVVSLFNY